MSADRIRVNLTETRGAIEKLKVLKATYEKQQGKQFAVLLKDEGQTHQKVEEIMVAIKQSWDSFIALVDKTIEFLQVDSDMIDTTDQSWKQ